MSTPLPPCGLYRTTAPIGSIPAGRLVYFHNHGDPGPGLYLPASWKNNRMQAQPQGTLLPRPEDAENLLALPAEGFYCVVSAFHCCEKQCRRFDPEMLVQLGYDGSGEALLFLPELVDGNLALPTQGSRVDLDKLANVKLLRIATAGAREPHPHPTLQ